MGGPSREAEVSRHTGQAIGAALKQLGYQVSLIEYDPPRLAAQLKAENIDIVFIALHGKYGEDGTVQGHWSFSVFLIPDLAFWPVR